MCLKSRAISCKHYVGLLWLPYYCDIYTKRSILMETLCRSASFLCLLLWMSCADSPEITDLPDVVDFNLHIRPILSNNCYVCHGPDISSREADLRLDLEETAKEKNSSGVRPIVAGNAARSEVYRRIATSDTTLIMPPPFTNKKLSDREVALIEKWIDQGAPWKKHWAFMPPEHVPLPRQVLHPVDAFIDERAEKAGLRMAHKANNTTLARRLSYVLIGLPPAPEALQLDLQDSLTYEKYVDQLLASPRFGERWARHWMDLARYAEGRGHEFDYPVIGAWHYRDYLIRALNNDVPYDQFILEQLAGDLLTKPRVHDTKGFNESKLGTMFLNLGEGKHSPVDSKDEEKVRIDNMIDVTSKTFQAMTVACSRCHDHKFDPIPTRDYYAMYGMFESSRTHVTTPYVDLGQMVLLDSIKNARMEIERFVKENMPVPQAIPVSHNATPPSEMKILGDFRDQYFGEWTTTGEAFGHTTTLHQMQLSNDGASIATEGAASSRYYTTGLPGALRSPNFVIDRDYLHFKAAGMNSSIRIILDNLQLIQNPIHGAFRHTLYNEEDSVYSSYVGMWKGNKAYIEFLPGEYYAKNGKRHHYRQTKDSWIEASYVVASDSADIRFVSSVMSTRASTSSPTVEVPSKVVTKYKALQDHVRDVIHQDDYIATVSDGPGVLSPVFIRGDHRELSKDEVPHDFLEVLDIPISFDTMGSHRLQYAKAMIHPDNPLTARVMANRLWHHLFGRGIVKTVDNFGLQGTFPDNLALLDHLALKYVELKWSTKALIRYIVTSEAFKRSTARDSSNQSLDPDNICLSTYPVRRLEAEAIRDGMLAVSGDLDTTMYGPSVTLHLTEFQGGRGKPTDSGPLNGHGRRSVYLEVMRNFLSPFMLTFDMPIPFSTFGDRSETNVPAQSLTLLNDPFVQEQAHIWATKVMVESKNSRDRIVRIYRQAFSRDPSTVEIEDGLSFVAGQQAHYQQLEQGQTEFIAWADFCHTIFNMKEFIYML